MNELMPNEKKFIQIINIDYSGFVDFYLAITDATTNVELRLPFREFIEFCQNNKVSFFTEEQELLLNEDNLLWKYGTK